MTTALRCLAAAALTLATHAAFAHARVLEASPRNGDVLATAPAELRLKFNEAVEMGFTSVKLLGPDGKDVAVGKPEAVGSEGNAIVLSLPALASGAYKAQWAAVGHDGHRTKGEVAFSVK